MNDENQADDGPRDLLGAPIDQAREKWGAPDHKVTVENQRLVTILRAAGWKQERIAKRLGVDPKTLRKHYSRELAEAADMVEAMALEQIMGRAVAGNIAAARKLLDLVEKGHAAVPLAPDDDQDAAGEGEATGTDAAKPLGKKERQAEAARNPGAGWGGLLN